MTTTYTYDYNANTRCVPRWALTEAKDAVLRGAQMLDHYHTEWFLHTDPNRLVMKDATCCILGQTGKAAHPESDTGYTTELHDITTWLLETTIFPNPIADRWDNIDRVDTEFVAVYYGFDLPLYGYTDEGTLLWPALDREWRIQILARQDRWIARHPNEVI